MSRESNTDNLIDKIDKMVQARELDFDSCVVSLLANIAKTLAALCDTADDRSQVPEAVSEIVHCQDCKFFGDKYQRCGILNTDKAPNGFCDEAIRRDTK